MSLRQPDDVKFIDIESALARVRGNKTLVRRMLTMFLETDEIKNLENELTEHRYEDAAKSAHAIKGVAGNLALSALFESSTVLNEQLKAGAPSDEAVDSYRSVLSDTVAAVKEAIDSLA